MRRLFLGCAATCLWLAIGGSALADVIDGDWCQADGRHLSIRGPTIVTPAGNQIAGDYSRHAFSYQVPPSEPAPGTTVHMRLVNETTVNLWMESDAATAEVWRRCTPIAGPSALPLPLG